MYNVLPEPEKVFLPALCLDKISPQTIQQVGAAARVGYLMLRGFMMGQDYRVSFFPRLPADLDKSAQFFCETSVVLPTN